MSSYQKNIYRDFTRSPVRLAWIPLKTAAYDSESSVDPHTIQAYLDTEYHVILSQHLTLRVGQPNEDLLAAHQRQKVDCSAFLTACNPYSEVTEPEINAARQAALAQELANMNLAFFPGVGKHPSNGWPGEDSFLVFGLGLEAAVELGGRFGQNGFIWCDSVAVPQLILLR